jgi:hypothetical protein
LPWGICNYHLSVVTPYVLGIFFPLYSFFNRKSRLLRLLSNGFIVILVIFIYIYIIVPRIAKMADIKKTVTFLKDSSIKGCRGRYFFPPPFVESAYGMSVFTGIPIKYLENGTLSVGMLTDDEDNFIIFDDQGLSVRLSNVEIGKEVYRNDNWVIYKVSKSDRPPGEFREIFRENFLEKVKSLLKR